MSTMEEGPAEPAIWQASQSISEFAKRLAEKEDTNSDAMSTTLECYFVWAELLANQSVRNALAYRPPDGRSFWHERLQESFFPWLDVTRAHLDGDGTLRDSLVSQARHMRALLALVNGLMWQSQSSESATPTVDSNFLQYISARIGQLEKSAAVDSLLKRAKVAVEAAEAAAESSAAAAGKTAQNLLSTHYGDLANAEGRVFRFFLSATISFLLLGGGLAFYFLLTPEFSSTSNQDRYVLLIQRVVVTTAVFGFAGYLARQASHHRAMWNWARSLTVQLKTFDAYLAPITDDDTQHELRKAFAERAFGEHPVAKSEQSVTPTALATEKLLEIISKIPAR